MTLSTSFTPPKISRDNVISVLDGVIGTIDFTKELVPVELAKGVLSSMSSILSIVRDTMKNKDDFIGVAEECKEISVVVWHATDETTGRRTDDPMFVRAIEGLQSTVEKIRSAIDEKSERQIVSRIFAFSVDKDEISGWKEDLARALQLFSAKLNVLANVKVGNLVAMLEEKLSNKSPQLNERLRQPPPATPVYLVGRSDIVRETVQKLIRSRHVALAGPGGIGKTSIAKAVINDGDVESMFGVERYFVAFDDHDSVGHHDSAITLDVFVNHIANALGLRPAKADKQKIVLSYFAVSSRRVLLVLDNAETFLHASKETGRIANMIDDLGALSSVVILLTTRSLALPPNLRCESVAVPPLTLGAARKTFLDIYVDSPIDSTTLDYLLTELDCHPLSINLLAQAAHQNQWSEKDLSDAWKREKTHVLATHSSSEGAAGKNQSLAVSINLSLNSPAFLAVSPKAYDFLQIVAFLPEGADIRKLEELMPTVPNPRSIVDGLCRLSLTYRKGGFVTMLAPIRMHILSDEKAPISQFSLLNDVRLFYIDQLQRGDSTLQDPHKPRHEKLNGALIRTEDVNIERLLAYDMDSATNMKQKEAVAHFCVSFMRSLSMFKPRTTILEAKIQAMPTPRPRRLLCITLPTVTNRLLFTKAWGFFFLGELAGQVVAEVRKALSMYELSYKAFEALNARQGMMACLDKQGSLYQTLGDFVHAEKLTTDALKIAQAARDPIGQGRLSLSLAMLSVFMGRPDAARLAETGTMLLESIPPPETENLDYYLDQMDTCLVQGWIAYYSNDSPSARRHFQAALDICGRMPDKGQAYGNDKSGEAILGLSDIALRDGKIEEAVVLLDKCRMDSLQAPLGFKIASASLGMRASLAAEQGDFDAARGQADQAVALAISQGEGNMEQATSVYLLGRIELLAGDLAKAKAVFRQANTLFDALSDVRFKARGFRAIGEIAVLEQDSKEAEASFGEAKSLCKYMGIRPEFLYVCVDTYALPDRFGGWKSFLDGQLLAV